MKNKKLMHVGIAAAIIVLIKLLVPAVNGLTGAGVNVIAVAVATVYMWITIGVDWVSMLSIALFACTGATTANALYQASFGNWLTPFLIVGMILNGALGEYGVTVRIVKWFMTRKFLEGRPWLFIITYLFAFYFVSLFLDCGPAALIFLPMAQELCEQLGYQKGDKFPKVIFSGILTCILLGFCATPISHIIPVMFIGFIGRDMGITVSFLQYMSVGIPYTLAVFALMIAFFRFVIRPDVSKGKITVITYLIVIFFWLLPDIGKSLVPDIAAFVSKIGLVIAPAIAVSVLCLIKSDGESIINFPKALTKISWVQIILVACMNAVGACITSADAGITKFLATTFTPLLTNAGSWLVIVAIVTIWVLVQTNFMSCLVSGQMVYAIIVPLIAAIPTLGVSAVAIALLICIVCNIGIMTPPASGPAAIFITTDWFLVKDSLRYGLGITILCIAAGIFICYPLAAAIF